jgi:V/A-type H+-transporting ATPase subunit F
MANIAVVGEERNVLGFKPFGVDVYLSHESGEDLEDWFRSIVKKEYKLILITEPVARRLHEQIQALWEKDFPVVLTISGLGKKSSAAFDRLRGLVIKAVGTDLLKEN